MVNVKRSETVTNRNHAIGQKLADLRYARDLSLRVVAKKLNPPVTGQTLHKWEIGTHMISVERIEQLAKIYQVNPAELLGYK